VHKRLGIMKSKVGLFLLMLFFAACTDEETLPEGDSRLLYTGDWLVNEQSKLNGNSAYPSTISSIGENDSISIGNFYGLGNSINCVAIVVGNSITIPFQDVDNGILVTGSGLRNTNGSFSITYYTNDSGSRDTVTATYKR